MSSNKRMPKNYRLMARQYPQFMAAIDALGEAAATAGPLPDKIRHLVQIGAAAAIRSEGAVHSHTNVMAALSWVTDVTDGTGR